MFLSFMALFVYVHSGWKSQTQEDAARNKAALCLSSSNPPPSPLFFPYAEMQQAGMLGVSKLASVLGVPGE